MAKSPSLADLLKELDAKQVEIRDLMAQVQDLIRQEKAKAATHSKRIIKQGMAAYFAGIRRNPYAKDSDEAEWWDYGYALSKDAWSEMKDGAK